MNIPLLSVENLTMSYLTSQGEVRAVDDVSFALERGQSLGLVGESGSGKTTLALALMKLLPENAHLLGGHIYLDGTDLALLSENQLRPYRWNRISMIFQAAMNSLDPVYRVGDQVAEAIELHKGLSHADAMSRVGELFDLVGIDRDFISRYPHEYSGGMRQRAIIAMALACDPDIVIADEPTTALDVIVQDRMLRELREIQKQRNMGMIYITHDIGVVAEVTDYVGVMYGAKLVELGRTEDVFQHPMHPYTRALLSAFPSVTGEKRELVTLEGEPPDLTSPPEGCRFHPRCPYATDLCRKLEPPVAWRDGQWAACWNPVEQPAEAVAAAERVEVR
jgi:peptide/nickel transport system ATP-binding protein